MRPAVQEVHERAVERMAFTLSTVLMLLLVAIGCVGAPTSRHAAATSVAISKDPGQTPAPALDAGEDKSSSRQRCFWDTTTSPAGAESEDLDRDVASLVDVNDMPYICSNLCAGGPGCGDVAFWRVVRHGKAALPMLLARLDDTTPTAATIPNYGRKYAIGDVAWTTIRTIAPELSGYELVGISPSKDCGACAWWKFVWGPKQNRRRLKDAAVKWFAEHGNSLKWTTAPRLAGMDCVDHCEHPAGGHFELLRQENAVSPR